MKKIIAALAGVLICASAFAEAPELKNMMPNSWQKLTRLPEKEERAFLQDETVWSESQKCIDEEYGNHDKADIRVYAETNSSLEFYRMLICNGSFGDFLNTEYRNKTMTREECDKFRRTRLLQIVFMKDMENKMRNIKVLSYRDCGASNSKWERFGFSDLMIKPLNEDEIGFFITEVTTGFYLEGEGEGDIIDIVYGSCKKQQVGGNSCRFFKVKNNTDIAAVFEKCKRDYSYGIRIGASSCLFDSKCPLKYSIQNAFDGDPATSYVENTEDNLMRIVFRQISIRKDLEIKFSIINGYGSNASLYEANNRIKKCGLANGANTPFLVELNDMNLSYQAKTIKRDESAYTGLFEFVVTDIYKGSKYNDTCIAELNFWDNSEKEWLFGEINE